MASQSTASTSASQRLVFWVAFGLTSAALVFAAVRVWKVTRGPGAPDANPHFAGMQPPVAVEGEEEGGDATLSDQEREHLDEILRERAGGKPAPR